MTAQLSPTRLEMIRAAVALNPTCDGQDSPAYRDRADLLGHVDWLNERLVAAERLLAQRGVDAAPELRGTKALILYFGTDEDRDEFAALVFEAKPHMIARNV